MAEEKHKTKKSVSYEIPYSDGDGTEFGISCDGGTITFERVGEVDFPIGMVDWLISRLYDIKSEYLEILETKNTSGGGE